MCSSRKTKGDTSLGPRECVGGPSTTRGQRLCVPGVTSPRMSCVTSEVTVGLAGCFDTTQRKEDKRGGLGSGP